jgi:hypothetical protein
MDFTVYFLIIYNFLHIFFSQIIHGYFVFIFIPHKILSIFFYDFECFFVYIIDECKMHIVLNYLMKI